MHLDLTAGWATTVVSIVWTCTYAAVHFTYKPKWRRKLNGTVPPDQASSNSAVRR